MFIKQYYSTLCSTFILPYPHQHFNPLYKNLLFFSCFWYAIMKKTDSGGRAYKKRKQWREYGGVHFIRFPDIKSDLLRQRFFANDAGGQNIFEKKEKTRINTEFKRVLVENACVLLSKSPAPLDGFSTRRRVCAIPVR